MQRERVWSVEPLANNGLVILECEKHTASFAVTITNFNVTLTVMWKDLILAAYQPDSENHNLDTFKTI